MFPLKWILVVIHITPSIGIRNEEPVLYYEAFKKVFVPPEMLEQDSLFGYSIANQVANKRLIISAPRSGRYGDLFTCDIETEQCKYIHRPKDIPFDENIKKNWYGATVRTGSNFIVTCAPRITSHGNVPTCFYKNHEDNEMKSMFWVNSKHLKNDVIGLGKKYVPDEQTVTTFGWSMHIDNDDSILVGGPGMFTGRSITYSGPSDYPYLVNDNFKYPEGQVSYNFGYSTIAGQFISNSSHYAIGTTYGKAGIGEVLFFDKKRDFTKVVIKGEEVGSMFGASLGSAQLSPGCKALLVGAPTYSPEIYKPDIGAVYIYIQNFLTYKRKIVGYQSGSYFGSVIVSVGDLNGDNVDEVAISAPYENEGRGTVYIYSGADLVGDEDEVKWVQKLKGDKKDQNFGTSLSVLKDYDKNGCNELAVGSPGNGSVILLRCMASIIVKLDTEMPAGLKDMASKLGTKQSFFFNSCLNITYVSTMAAIETVILLTVSIIHPHAILWSEKVQETYKVPLSIKNNRYCYPVEVILPFEGDYVQDIKFNISIQLEKDPNNMRTFNPRLAKLDSRSDLWKISTAKINARTQLKVSLSTSLKSHYMIGSSELENVNFMVENTGFIAYDTKVRFHIVGVGVSLRPANCTYQQEYLTCLVLGPLRKGEFWASNLTLETKSLTTISRVITISAEVLDHGRVVHSTGLNVSLETDASNVYILGYSHPPVVNTTITIKNQRFEHSYMLINKGTTHWENIQVDIIFPPYVSYSTTSKCKRTGKFKALCIVDNLAKRSEEKLTFAMEMLPDVNLKDKFVNGSLSLVSNISLMIGVVSKQMSVTTILTLVDVTVPLWIYIAASIVGILILFIIAFALYECGFLRRKNHEKLVHLKEEIKRQSMIQPQRRENPLIKELISRSKENLVVNNEDCD